MENCASVQLGPGKGAPMVWAVRSKGAIMADTEEIEQEEGIGLRSQTWLHEAYAEWLADAKEYGDLNDYSAADIISIAFAHRVEWRRTDRYQEVKEEHRSAAETARAERQAAREAEKAEKAKAAAEAKAAKEAEAAAKTDGKTTAKATKGAAKAAPAAKKATKATTRRGAKPATEDPFG